MARHGLPNARIGLAGAVHESSGGKVKKSGVEKRASSCPVSQMYKYPTSSTSITTSDPLTLTWDPSCLTTTNIDIYLYSYLTSSSNPSGGQTGMIHAWTSIPWSPGSYDLGKFDPSWWNNTGTTSLQLSMVEAGNPRFFATYGPVFTATVPAGQLSTATGGNTGVATITTTAADGSKTTTVTDSSGIFQIPLSHPQGLAKGAMAAAIVVPILVVGVLVGLYIKFARVKEMEKRKRWSEHVDRRMSTISGDWRSGGGSVAGGPRASMASARTGVNSTYMGSGARGSTYTLGAGENMAGAGAGGGRVPRENINPEMRQSQLRQSIFNNSSPNLEYRQSRVSFAADDILNNNNSRKSRVSFSDSALRPTQSNLSGLNGGGGSRKSALNPDGERHSIDNSRLGSAKFSQPRKRVEEDTEFALSPSQAQGPFVLPTVAVQGGETQAVPAKKGLFSALASAVGLKDSGSGKQEVGKQEQEKDREQAESTRRSEDRLRNMEAVVLRRSQIISQYSINSQNTGNANGGNGNANGNPSPAFTNSVYLDQASAHEDDAVEELAPAHVRATSPMGMAMPATGMNPDQLLAAYAAARNGASSTSTGTESNLHPNSATTQRPTSTGGMSDASVYSGTTAGIQPPPQQHY